MTAPDARHSDELRGLHDLLTAALDDTATGLWMTADSGPGWGRAVAAALLPVVTDWAEKQARARAAEELWAAARHWQEGGRVPDLLHARAAALAADDRTDPA